MHKDADEATSFIAIATYHNEGGSSQEVASFPPEATIRDVFTAFFTNPDNGRKLLRRRPSSLELKPDHLTIPRKSDPGMWDVGELLGEASDSGTKAP